MNGEKKPPDVDAKRFVEVGFGDFLKRGQFRNSGVGKQDVNAALVLPHRVMQPVKIEV